jgi:signal transduction histidine kinase
MPSSVERSSMATDRTEKDRIEALTLLDSIAPHDRLKAARTLRRARNSDDAPKLRAAIKAESVSWVKRALTAALTECSAPAESDAGVADASLEMSERLRHELYGKITQEITGILLHEIEPVFGLLRAAASEEIADRSKSQTWTYLEYLKKILLGIQALRIAASAPNLEEFDLAELIAEVAAAEVPADKATVSLLGHQPLVCKNDAGLLRLALANGFRNAVDALDGVKLPEGAHAIIVTWGQTDIDYWITVIDKGRGLELRSDVAFDTGNTTKKGHPGMGLSIARRAMDSLEGTADLEAKEDGTHFELRWLI